MKGFFPIFAALFKNRLFSRSFWAACAVLLGFTASFALLCPRPAPPSAKIGLIFDESDPELAAACGRLMDYEEISFVRCQSEEQLCRDVMSGILHCGYKIDPLSQTPITVYETSGSFLTPMLDELVFAAWFEDHLCHSAPMLYDNGSRAALIAEEISRRGLEDKPLSIDITINAAASGGEYRDASFAPVMYAVMIPLCLLAAALCAMLAPESERETLALLAKTARSRPKLALARLFAEAAPFLLLWLGCEAALAALSVPSGFSPAARLAAAAAVSLVSAAFFPLLPRGRANPALLFGLMAWAAVSVVFSGAIVSPQLFPGLGWLRFFSPSWLLLRLMAAL